MGLTNEKQKRVPKNKNKHANKIVIREIFTAHTAGLFISYSAIAIYQH
jgi:hypothetical protein